MWRHPTLPAHCVASILEVQLAFRPLLTRSRSCRTARAVIDPPRPLVEGERLDQPTFHARYLAMPPARGPS